MIKTAPTKQIVTLLLALFPLIGAGFASAQVAQPVLVELFTSEGCSSCPPADALLRRLVTTQPLAGVQVIALEEHVDYWDSLGWHDPFSAAQFTRRQYQYAAALGNGSVYTPQMMVNGRVAFVGSDSARVRQAIASAGKVPLATISLVRTYIKANTVGLRLEMKQLPAATDDDVAEVWLAVTEDNLANEVTAGENDGRQLTHDAVVRRLERIGRINLSTGGGYNVNPAVALAPDWHKAALRAVVFVQGASSRHILGMASLALAPSGSH